MRGVGMLFLEEFNRVPWEMLNVLLTVLTEAEIVQRRVTALQAQGTRRTPQDLVGELIALRGAAPGTAR
jgi:hypothetical protein